MRTLESPSVDVAVAVDMIEHVFDVFGSLKA
jgi:hypothetical protein